jgi:hypothetical protein
MRPCATRFAVLCVLALGSLSACGANDGEGTADRPSVTTSLSPTRALPSPTRSAEASDQSESESARPSRSAALPPDTTRPDKTTPGHTSSSTQQPEPTARQPTVRTSTVIAVPVPSATSPAPSLSSSPSPTPDQDEATAENHGMSSAVWVALAVLAVAATVGTWLLMRTRRRRTWLTRLQATRAEVEWFARELMPQLRQSGSVDRVAGGWQVADPRITAAEDQLTVLESSAHSPEDAASARQLRDAVRSAREKMETLSGPGRHDEWALDLDDVEGLLVTVLGPTSVGSASAPRAR